MSHYGIMRIVVPVMTLLLMAVSGCNSKKQEEKPGVEVIEQTYKVEPNATVRITNARGSVTIRGEDTSEVRMRAVKSGSSAAQLKAIDVDASAEAGDVLIKTTFPRQKNSPLFAGTSAVDLTLSVPRSARIARVDVDDGDVSIDGIQNSIGANIVNGQLAIRNCCGDLKIAVANGGLDLLYGRCEAPYFSADAQVLHGDVRLSVARDAAIRIHGETLDGKIANNAGPMMGLNGQVLRKIDLPFGNGRRCDLRVRVTSGDITIVPTEPGAR